MAEQRTITIPWPTIAPTGGWIGSNGVQEVWDAFIKPGQASAKPQSVEERVLMGILRAVHHGLTATPATPPPMIEHWQAVAVDADGFVLDDETLRAWAKAIEEGKTGWGVPCEPPARIEIVRDSAAPKPQSDDPDEKFYRLPGSWMSDDKFLELDDLDEQEPRDVLLLWKRAQAAVAGMNAACVR